MKEIEKFPASTLFDEMNKCHQSGNHRYAVIVFSQSNWEEEYSETSRSYISYSDQWGWDYSKLGHCRIGDCLDGEDMNVRLDWHEDWKIDYWYWAD